MTEISVLDLQNLRHLIDGFETTHCKMQDYAHEAQDTGKTVFPEVSPVCNGKQAAVNDIFAVGGRENDR